MSASISRSAAVSSTDHVETSNGRTSPSIDEDFSPANTPGLELSTFKYVKSSARAAFDWRRQPGYSGSGGLYRAQFDDFDERDNGLYSFKSLEAEALQLIPILRANWVIALRGLDHAHRHRRQQQPCPTSCCRRSAAAPRCEAIRTSAFAIAIGC